MPIAIDNSLSAPKNVEASRLSAAWPWLLSLAMHGVLLVLLLYGLAQLRASHSQEDQFYLVSLLPPAGQTQTASNNTADVSSAVLSDSRHASTVPEPHARPLATAPEPRTRNRQAENPPARRAENQSPAPNPGTGAPAAASPRAGSGHISSLPGNGPYTIAQVDERPRILHHVAPVYPQLARRRGIEGWVEIKFLVTSHGRVSQESIVQAEPEGVFENSALTALRAWRFAPGMLKGQAVDTWVVQKINFRLTGAS